MITVNPSKTDTTRTKDFVTNMYSEVTFALDRLSTMALYEKD